MGEIGLSPVSRILSALGRCSWVNKELLVSFPDAIGSGGVYLVYPPKLDMRTGRIEGVEALISCAHPNFGDMNPSLLTSLIEASRRMDELTLWVLRRAIIEQRYLAVSGHYLTVFVNLTASLVSGRQFINVICVSATDAQGQIGLEITETSKIAEPQAAIANLARLVDVGFDISIDQYGKGLSYLLYLHYLPASELRIDKQFISGMTRSHGGTLIVRSTIDFSHALEMTVVAEGIENFATLVSLRAMGYDYGQGFLISRPLQLNMLKDFLDQDSTRDLLKEAVSTFQPPESFWAHADRERSAELRCCVTPG